MLTKDVVVLISRNLRIQTRRTGLAVNGVIIGTAAVVILASLGVGMQRGVMLRFESIGDLRAILVTSLEPDLERDGLAGEAAVVRPLLDDGALDTLRNIPGVVSVLPQVLPAGNVECTFQELTSVARLVGLDVRDLADLGYQAQVGETVLKPGTVILGQGALSSFGEMIEFSGGGRIQYVQLEADDVLGKKLRFVIRQSSGQAARTVELRVNGILNSGILDRNIYLRENDLKTWNRYATGKAARGYNQVVVEAVSIERVRQLAEEIEKLGFATSTQDELIGRVNQTYLLISILLWITGLTSLAISGVGVANTMTAAMMEQTPDIGLWKALGATNREVMLLIASQAAVIGLMGGIWGTLAGLLGVYLFNALGGMNMTIQVWGQDMTQGVLAQSPAWLWLASPVFSLGVGLLAGITPAMRAAALSPVDILKDE